MKENLSEEVIGCKHCLGEWIPASKVKKAMKEIRELLDTKLGYRNRVERFDKIVGEKLI